MPVSEKKKRKASPSVNGGYTDNVESLDMNGGMEAERENQRKGKGRKGKKGEGKGKTASNPDTLLIENMISQKGLEPNGKSSSRTSLNHSSNDLNMYDRDSDLDFQHSAHDSFSDTGPHREMAIDCPESFLAKVKSSSRYPSQYPASGSVPPGNSSTPNRNTDSVRDSPRTDTGLSDRAATGIGGTQPQPSLELLERLRMHQEELRKRREEEARLQQEDDFLRSSLRGSQKLQALQKNRVAQAQLSAPPPPSGVVNAGYMEADEEGELVDEVDQVEAPAQHYIQKTAGQILERNDRVQIYFLFVACLPF